MSPMIRVDDEVYERLNELGRTEDSFNDVVRRVPRIGFKKKSTRERFRHLVQSKDKGVSEVRKDIELFGIIDRHLPPRIGKETEARRDQIMEVVKKFSQNAVKYTRFQKGIARPRRKWRIGRGVEENTVLDKCGRQNIRDR